MRTFTVTWLVVLAGCQTAPPPKPQEAIPAPFTAHGATISLLDERHDWEKQQVVGPVSIYRISRVFPNAWTQLAKETEAVVGTMSEKPQRVEVFVTSFRLVRKEDKPSIHDPSDNVKIGKQTVAGLNGSQNKLAYEQLRQANANGDQKAANAVGTGLLFADGNPAIAVKGRTEEPEEMPGTLSEHPAGASCRVRATVRMTFADGREKVMDVKAICAGQNTSGTQYWGEALDFAAGQAVRQYGHQLRTELGVNP
jgi:hypothetical protein